MEYRDVLNIVPGSYIYRTPSPGSVKVESIQHPEHFKWDYKTSYKSSPYFIRRYRPIPATTSKIYTNNKIEQSSIDKYNEMHPTYQCNVLI